MNIFLKFLLIYLPYVIIYGSIVSVNSFNLSLIHINDLHSHFAPVNVWSSPCDEKSIKSGKCFGGIARIAAEVKKLRESHKNSLFLNAGDSFQGTVWYSLYKSSIVSHFTNLLKYDAMTVGNHEFDDGIEGYYPFLDDTRHLIPTVCCNIDVSDEPRLNGKIKKSIILEVDEHKIGIIGYLTPETSFLSNPGKTIKFVDEIESIRKEVKHLQSLGIKIIIGLGHSGFVRDVEIAQNVPELDVIVGGHSHTLLYSGEKPSVEDVVDKYPTVVNHGSHQTIILQAYANGKYLGLINLEFDSDGNITRFDGQPILLDNKYAEDPIIAQEINGYDKQIREKYGEVIGKSNVLLEGGYKCEVEECNLGNLITEAMVVYYMKNRQQTGNGWTDVAVSVTNGGGIRATIDTSTTGGNITLEHLITTLPFSNNMMILEIPGQLLKEMLEYSVSRYDIWGGGKFLQFSGLRVVYNLTKSDYNKVDTLSVRCSDCNVPEFRPLNETMIYKVIVPKYIADGGDGYQMLKSRDIKRITSEALDYEIVSQYLKETSVIYTGVDDRIQLIH
ncbi:protein 5NUC-like [Oppia nitens]|uniref:protein 5NUC-like n=1 Tax=Oppia nitens TaxID=1686743 RepID=UPI0023DAD343|nr:protein 5NUC-like [Oppia nitens]